MKLIDIFLTNVKFVKRQGVTSSLILIYPIILIVLVGMGLSITSDSSISIAVCSDGSEPLFAALAEDKSLYIVSVGTEEELIDLVKNKHVIMGIYSSVNDSRKSITIYKDPTKEAITSNVLLLLDKKISEERERTGESLGALQIKLAADVNELRDKYQQMDEMLADVQELRSNVSQASYELNQTYTLVDGYRADLVQYKSDLSKIDEYKGRLDDYGYELSLLRNTLDEKQEQKTELRNKIRSSIVKIDSYTTKVDNIISKISAARPYITNPTAQNLIDDAESELYQVRSDLQQARSDLVEMDTMLDTIDLELAIQRVDSVQSDIRQTSLDLYDFKQDSSQQIDSAISDIDATKLKIRSALESLDSFQEKIDSFERQLVRMKGLMKDILDPLEEFMDKKPEELMPPQMNIESALAEQKAINSFFPAVIGIDMVLASLLLPMIMKVRMREQGVEQRLLRSKAGTLSIILGETFAFYLICLVQLGILCLFGLLFGVNFGNIAYFLLVLLAVPMVFTAQGVLFSQFVNRTSTAFLLSLMMGLPMIFISGVIIPIEFMHPLIGLLGQSTPLYVMVDFVEKLFLRGTGLAEVAIDYIYINLFVLGNLLLAVLVSHFKR